jgi:hypothetical protein
MTASLLLAKSSYRPVPITPSLWTHDMRPIDFSLVVDDFGVKYGGKEHVMHLLEALRGLHMVTEDWDGSLFSGLTIQWNYADKYVDISMPHYIPAMLHRFQHPKPAKHQGASHSWTTPTYGASVKYATPPDDSLGCPQMTSDSNLAASLTRTIQAAESELPPPSTQELQELAGQKEELHVVLAYLWAVLHKLVGAVAMNDLPESTQLNHQCELIQGKIRAGGRPGTPSQGAPLPSTTGKLTALMAVAQTLMTTMSNAEVARARDRSEDRASK